MNEDPLIIEGGCHCGAVRYRLTLTRPSAREVLDCNCTVCTKKGFLHLIVTRDEFTLLRGADALSTYTFNTHVAKHHFCRTCGVHSFYVPRSHPDGYDVNARCLDVALTALPFTVAPFDGQRWERSVDAIR